MSARDGESFSMPVDDPFDSAVEFDPQTGTYSCAFDRDERLPTEAVVAVVARANRCDPMTLPPLYGDIDPDALDSIFATPVAGGQPKPVSVTFEYADHVVTVRDERVLVLAETE